MWLVFALLSAIFAAFISILAKIGIDGVNSNLATAIRTVAVVVMAWGMVFLTNAQNGITEISRKSWIFLILSGLATGASWLCYYRALQIGDASKVVPVDKLSVVITLMLAFVFLHEEFTLFDPIVSAVIGGLLMGVGCGVIYKIGGSTGGFDVPGLIINKFTRIKLSILFFIQDGLLVILALVANFSLYEIIIGLISVLAYSLAVSLTQRIGYESYFCDIISDKWEEINTEILKLDRGTTLVDVVGGFTGRKRKMIKTMIGKNQYLTIIDIVKKIDPEAFVSISSTHEVFGEGYRDIKDYSNK